MSRARIDRRFDGRDGRERGALLGIVLILMVVLLAASGFALWSLRSDTAGAGNDRLERQLFDCAEQGLAWGKQYFSITVWAERNTYLSANVCATLSCPPFPTSASGVVRNYPDGAPYTNNITLGNASLTYTVAIMNNSENPASPLADNDNSIVVYSRCRDTQSGMSRSVQAIMSVTQTVSDDYKAQMGFGSKHQGNMN